MPPLPPLHVVGRFPPPRDGQTLATERLAGLLAERYAVLRTSVTAPEAAVAAEVRLRPGRALHYLGTRRHLRTALAAHPEAPVLWPSVSPAPLGHARDILITVPAFLPGQPVVAVVHRGDFDRLFCSPLTRRTARELVRRLRAFVFTAEGLAERCAPWIPLEKRLVIPNTIAEDVRCSEADVARKREARRERWESDPLRLLFLSNMIPSKGYTDVLEAVALLRDRGAPVHADFAGRWSSAADRAAFERVVSERGLEKAVVHHGALSDPAPIRARYLAADIFLLPTYYPTEAQPLTILEALNAGTPVVATAHASIPEVVRDGVEGLLVPPRDPAAVADAVARLAEPEVWDAFSRRARARFEDAYSPEAVRARWFTLLDGLA